MDLISIFGTHDVPKHSEPALRHVRLLGRSIRQAIARLHTSLAGQALDIAHAQRSFIVIADEKNGDAQYVVSGVMLDDWYLVESSDVGAEPGALKSFYLLPISQATLAFHENHLPYLEFTTPDFGKKYLGNAVHSRRIYLYVLWQLLEIIKMPDHAS